MVTVEAIRSTSERKPPLDKRAWGIVIFMFLFFTLNFADKAAVGLASTQIREDLGLSAGQYGLLSSAFFWMFALGAVVLSAALRKISYTWGAGLLMASWVLCMLPLTVQTSFGVLLAARVALGFFEGPAHALCQSIVADRFAPEKRATAGAIVNAGSSVGPLVAAPTLTWVILTWHWHGAFVVLVAVGTLWIIGWAWFSERLPFRKGAEATSTVAKAEKKIDPNGHIVVPFHRLLTLRSFWGLVMLSFAGYLISSLKVAWLPAYMHEGLGYSSSSVGTLVTIPYAVAVVFLLSAGMLSGRLLRRGYSSRVARGYLTTAYLVFGGLSMVVFTQLERGPIQLVLVICGFAVNSVAFSVAFAGASDFLPAHQRVGFFGCIIAAYSVAGIVAPYVLGVIVDHAATPAEGYATGFMYVGIAVCVFGIIGGLMLNPERARRTLEKLTLEYAAKEDAR
ncbi:MFS transporter [Nocardioides sp. Root151]|uniref:MFS transporter n=2 Tax=unclassified Nocardioides TaxID=2615069 RepID=UPI0007026B72|nr:MFS transporter [Nocardioides sp. Root151]KQZ76207.1 MFS transporter [Nocardioides sp. Root151]KRF10614.1 MFS transporter [Nocardioides sp. Soil796]